MRRVLYTVAWHLALPFAFLYLLWRARRQPDYLRHWSERLGFAPRLQGPVIWLHTVSVGETRAAAPLIEALRAHWPDHAMLLTHATPTGREIGRALFGGRIEQAYLPYDLPWAVDLFLGRTQPMLALFMETEIWPNLLRACRQRGIPTALINARLSARSARGYRRLGGLTRAALLDFSAISAQTDADAARLRELGAEAVMVTGNLKFDLSVPNDMRARGATLKTLFGNRFVLLAASTREGEEALLLDKLLRLDLPDVLLVLVPRHPQRFERVAALIEAHGQPVVRRSARQIPTATDRVYLGDSLGELAAYYLACDLAFVGGSLLPLGGQNLIEACACGAPVLVGPHTWNFSAAAEAACSAGAAWRVHDVDALVDAVCRLHDDAQQRKAMRQAGQGFIAANRGATQRTLALVSQLI